MKTIVILLLLPVHMCGQYAKMVTHQGLIMAKTEHLKKIIALIPAGNMLAQDPTDFMEHTHRGKIILFCRGTLSKAGMTGRQFNFTDTNATHIGIGYVTRNRAYIYHISDEAAGNALRIDSLDSFLGVKGIFYFSTWETDNNESTFNNFLYLLDSISCQPIYFDRNFDLANGKNSMYCSEFCAGVLNSLPAGKWFVPSLAILNPLYAAILQRKVLEYFPVDFFLQGPFIKTFELKAP